MNFIFRGVINRSILFLNLIITCCAVSLAHADLLSTVVANKAIEDVSLARSAKTSIGDKSINLFAVGAGLRKKKVLLLKLNVYVAQLFVSQPEKFIKTPEGALNSLDELKVAALKLTFLRNIDAEKIKNSFKEGLESNGIDIAKDEMMKTLLIALEKSGEAQKGKSITLLIQKNEDGSEKLFFENTKGSLVTIDGPKGLTKNLFSIWLGKSDEELMTDLKNQLINSGPI